MNFDRIINNGSSLLRTLKARPIGIAISPIIKPRAFSQSMQRLEVDAIQKQILNESLKDLIEFHRNNVPVNQTDRTTALREAEEQAQREFDWLVEEVKLDRKKKDDITKTNTIIELVNRLLKNEPLSYVLGNQPFGPLLIKCSPPTLIPRPETEALTEYIFKQSQNAFQQHLRQQRDQSKPLRVLDLCCGSGCISLLIRHRLLELISKETDSQIQRAAFKVVGVDIANSALQLAKENSVLYNQSEHYGDLAAQFGQLVPITFEKIDILDDKAIRGFLARHGPFDVILCNPPYIPAREWKELDASVREWEDRLALVGHPDNESDGLIFYRRLANLIETQDFLTSSSTHKQLPLVAMEVGHDQAEKIKNILAGQKKLLQLEVWRDPFDKERAVIAKM